MYGTLGIRGEGGGMQACIGPDVSYIWCRRVRFYSFYNQLIRNTCLEIPIFLFGELQTRNAAIYSY